MIKNITGFKSFALPNLYSAHIAAFASFSAITGKLISFLISFTKLSSLKLAIFGAPTMVPWSEEIKAATLIPTPTTSCFC